MKKQIEHFPLEYFQISKLTIQEKVWTITHDTVSQANSARTKWYQFVASLKADDRVEDWMAAMRVIASVKGCVVTYTDRAENREAALLREKLAGLILSPLDIELAKLKGVSFGPAAVDIEDLSDSERMDLALQHTAQARKQLNEAKRGIRAGVTDGNEEELPPTPLL